MCSFVATDWIVANEELTMGDRYCIRNLTAGDLLHVRVVAVNPGGRSEPGILPEPVPIREIGGELKLEIVFYFKLCSFTQVNAVREKV